MVSMSATFPLDNGFLRRECPHCERHFKWHHGPTDDRPEDVTDPDVYFCPYCGETANPDEWWTREQLEYARGLLAGPALKFMGDKVEKMARSVSRNGLIRMEVQRPRAPQPPAALSEPSDMMTVLPPCHPWEPIMVANDWQSPIYCLVCGQPFTV